MKHYQRHSSGALVRMLTPEELEIQKLKIIIKSIIGALPRSVLVKIDPKILEEINDG